MWEKEQYAPWQQAALGYISHPLDAYASNPVWTDDPKTTPYRDAVKRMLWNGYSGPLGYASAAAMADYIRSEEHTSELQSLMRNSSAVFCLKKKKKKHTNNQQ